MKDAIALIHRAGGLAVLAHPAQSGTRERVEALVARARWRRGESSEPRPEDVSAFGARRAFQLVPSGGSDWHGGAAGPRTLGVMQVPPSGWSGRTARVLVEGGLR